jgi:hypothetical protein
MTLSECDECQQPIKSKKDREIYSQWGVCAACYEEREELDQEE